MSEAKTGQERLIEYRVEDRVAVIELSDPPANTYSYEMMRQLDDAILQARMDENVSVIVLRGAGEKFFCPAQISACSPRSHQSSNTILPACQ